MRVCFSTLVLLLFTAGASAQSPLTATPNPFDNGSGKVLVIRNATSAPVVIDSLQMASTAIRPPYDYTGAVGIGLQPDASGNPQSGFLTCSPLRRRPCTETFETPYTRTLASSDSLVLLGFGGFCEICRPAGGGRSDTLWVYTDGSAEPLRVAIENVQFVAAEAPPETSALRLDVAPNPSRGASVLSLVRASAGEARIVAYDLLGREVAVLHDGPAAEALDVRVDTSAWPVGAYIVRASAGREAATARLVVVR